MQEIKVDGDKLYTPIVTYGNGSQQIVVISTHHIGSQLYYQILQTEIDRISEGYYEGINDVDNPQNLSLEIRTRIQELGDCFQGYATIATILGITVQSGKLQYPVSWKNVDTSFAKIVAELPEDYFFVLRGIKEYICRLEKEYLLNPIETRLKIQELLFHHSAQPSTADTSLDKKREIEDRNRLLFDRLTTRISARDFTQVGLVYGAGHAPGIDLFLVQKHGFARTGECWVPFLERGRT